MSGHDDFCEAEYIGEAGGSTFCSCDYRRTRGLVAEHDRQVAERAWDEGFDEASDDLGRSQMMSDMGEGLNPYTKGEQKPLDPKPWLFISDQVFGEFRSDHDEGYNSVSGTYWTFSPRPDYSQNREDYAS